VDNSNWESLWGDLVSEMYSDDEMLFLTRLNEVRRNIGLPPRPLVPEAAAKGGEVSLGREMSLGERIAAARRARGMSQRELAAVAGCSVSLVSQIEQGRSKASVDFLRGVGRVLRLDGK
jgi:DNA-binding XRE family transcriptional regulator